MAQADIDIADEKMLPRAVELYNAIFRPKREIDFFKRRFLGRYNTLTLIAHMDNRPVGFWIGFELKPGMFYHWMGAVIPDVRARWRGAATAGGAAGMGQGSRLRICAMRVSEPSARIHTLRYYYGI